MKILVGKLSGFREGKKMKKTGYFLAGAIIYIGIAFLFSSYGNIEAHRNINAGIVEKFKSRFLDGIFTQQKFKEYHFLFESSVGLSGQSIVKGGYLSVTEETKSFSLKEWIVEGGYSADEPQLQACLRHFYDPTEPIGQRYLKDHLGSIESQASLTFNPRIDHVKWAITEPEHLYNWTIGKAKLKKALETNNKTERENNMAYAWRALGETLHMIADMGCPAHVRDDAHPGLFADYTLLNYFGNSDPYENICEQLTGKMVEWSKGTVDSDLKDQFFKAKTVGEIAHGLADYTNRNYFTTQTISGNGVIPRIHPAKTYASPKLDNCSYDASTYSYKKTISGHEVIMCRDLTFALFLFEKRGYPYIDKTCVESQAAALMPQIAEAGANAIRLFIPELKIEIEELDNNSIKGSVIHTTDDEYVKEIKYTGEIELIRSSDLSKVGTVDCVDGIFDAAIDAEELDLDWESEQLMAQISFGGITVRSEKKGKSSLSFTHVWVGYTNYSGVPETISSIAVSNSDHLSTPNPDFKGNLIWNGNSFSVDYQDQWTDWGGTEFLVSTISISGRISNDNKILESFSGRVQTNKSTSTITDYYITVEEIILQNVPFTSYNNYYYIQLTGVNLNDYIKKLYMSGTHKMEPERSWEMDKIDFSNLSNELNVQLDNNN
ncbi:hypothetical protein ACFLSY_03050 [Bacteroidota bacterium]